MRLFCRSVRKWVKTISKRGSIMISAITRRFAFAAALLAAFALAGCGDKEPEQRKAFMEFLQTRVINNRTVVNPALSEKEREAVGPYAAHYQVILDFHAGMNEVAYPLKDASVNQKLGNMPGLQANWREIAQTRATMAKLPALLDSQVKKAQDARAALKQPDDLKALYDMAFNRKVVTTAVLAQKVLTVQDEGLQLAEDLGKYLDENRSKVTVSAGIIQLKDPSIETMLKALQKKYNDGVRAMMAARQELMANR